MAQALDLCHAAQRVHPMWVLAPDLKFGNRSGPQAVHASRLCARAGVPLIKTLPGKVAPCQHWQHATVPAARLVPLPPPPPPAALCLHFLRKAEPQAPCTSQLLTLAAAPLPEGLPGQSSTCQRRQQCTPAGTPAAVCIPEAPHAWPVFKAPAPAPVAAVRLLWSPVAAPVV